MASLGSWDAKTDDDGHSWLPTRPIMAAIRFRLEDPAILVPTKTPAVPSRAHALSRYGPYAGRKIEFAPALPNTNIAVATSACVRSMNSFSIVGWFVGRRHIGQLTHRTDSHCGGDGFRPLSVDRRARRAMTALPPKADK
jgi:hypothetical protein